MITDFGAGKPTIAEIADLSSKPKTNPENPSAKGTTNSKPANEVISDSEVITDLQPTRRHEVGTFSLLPTRTSASTTYREAIELGLSRGRNAMAI